jgi:hypothetical protein
LYFVINFCLCIDWNVSPVDIFYIRDKEKMMNVINGSELSTVSGGENGGSSLGRDLGQAAAMRQGGISGLFSWGTYGAIGAGLGGGSSGVATGGRDTGGGSRDASGGGDRGTRGGF